MSGLPEAIRRRFRLPINDANDAKRRSQLVDRATLSTVVLTGVTVLPLSLAPFQASELVAALTGLVLVVSALAFLLNRRGYPVLASSLLPGVLFVAVSIEIFLVEMPFSLLLLEMLCPTVLTALLFNSYWGLLTGVVLAAWAMLLTSLPVTEPLFVLGESLGAVIGSVTFLFLVIIIYSTTHILEDTASRARASAQESRRSEARWRALAEHAPTLIVLSDLDGGILYVNTDSDYSGKTVFDFASPSAHGTIGGAMAHVRETGEATGYVARGDPDERWYSVRVGPLWEGDKLAGLVFVALDVTENKRADAERERLISELEAKNTELERFTYTVSHDLKAPLITIAGFAGFVERDAARDDPTRLRADVAQITAATSQMQRLLDDLLTLSRVGHQIDASEDAPLADVARDAVAMLAGQLTARDITVSITEPMPVVRADRTRLVEVFQNLIENAIKFTATADPPTIEVGARPAGDGVACYARDNGIGIASSHRERIFDIFDRLDHDVDGSGVGLSLVKRIVEQHGGRVWVESGGAGRGSTFLFTIP